VNSVIFCLDGDFDDSVFGDAIKMILYFTNLLYSIYQLCDLNRVGHIHVRF
jgi:hypothetical protein